MTNPTKPLDIEARELLKKAMQSDEVRACVGIGGGVQTAALMVVSELLTRLREVEGERDEARLHVSKTNNSVFGSYGYFTLPDASQEIERLKESNGNHWNAEQGLRSQLSTSQALLEECREVLKPFSRMKKDFDDCADNQPLVIEIPAHDIYQDFAVEDIRLAASLIEKLEGMG